MFFQSNLLRYLYKIAPFRLKGDLAADKHNEECTLSCIINFYERIQLLERVLCSLAEQDLSRSDYEVVLVEDRGGTKEGKEIAQAFASRLHIRYFTQPDHYGIMGFSRNYGLSKARGEYILFLDDDTVILQNNFLTMLLDEFRTSNPEAIVPRGAASYYLLKGRYGYHDPYFPTNRCTAYRRDVLVELGGFVSAIIGQEDVEFVTRFLAAGKIYRQSIRLEYFHPPLVVSSLNKPAAVGHSFARLRRRYPFVIWIMLLLNSARYIPLFFLPLTNKWKMQGRFSMGFLLGAVHSARDKEITYR